MKKTTLILAIITTAFFSCEKKTDNDIKPDNHQCPTDTINAIDKFEGVYETHDMCYQGIDLFNVSINKKNDTIVFITNYRTVDTFEAQLMSDSILSYTHIPHIPEYSQDTLLMTGEVILDEYGTLNFHQWFSYPETPDSVIEFLPTECYSSGYKF